jgi:hypothetical protein
VHFAQVGDEFAQRPAGEGLAELDRAGGGRRDDEILVVTAELAGTASRPLRVQAGQTDLVEPVDHVPDGVLIGLHQLRDHRDPVPAGRGQQHHRPPVTHRAGTAPAHDLLQLLPLLVGQSAPTEGLGHRASNDRIGRHRPSNRHDHQPGEPTRSQH